MPEFVLKPDIEKMYRQISVHKQRKFQQIFWRDSPEDPVAIYDLSTVTYGVDPFVCQALRCMQYLAVLEASSFLNAPKIIKENMNVHDFLFGSHSVESAVTLAHNFQQLLMAGGVPVRKRAAISSVYFERHAYEVEYLRS